MSRWRRSVTELVKKRVTVSFIFDITVDDDRIRSSGNDDEIKTLDLALLHQFLRESDEQVKRLLAEQVSLEISSWYVDDVMQLLTGEVGDEAYVSTIFTPAIEALPEPERTDWRNIRDTYDLNENVEQIIECFKTKLVESRIEVKTPEEQKNQPPLFPEE
jgi:hypothetical protein